jgi:hypothetical protein
VWATLFAIYSNRHSETSVSRSRDHRQIVWAKLHAMRDGAAIANKKLWS